jgi:hypothetical protein
MNDDLKKYRAVIIEAYGAYPNLPLSDRIADKKKQIVSQIKPDALTSVIENWSEDELREPPVSKVHSSILAIENLIRYVKNYDNRLRTVNLDTFSTILRSLKDIKRTLETEE